MAQDSSQPDFWESRYQERVTPWDAGTVPPALRAFATQLRRGSRILIPGCGSAYEACYLSEQGMDVLAIDFSPAAVETARRNLARFPDIVKLADFFELEPGAPFDLIYERAFLCALPPRMWDRYPARVASLLKPDGLLAGFFYFDQSVKGPPFGTHDAQLTALMSPHLDRIADSEVHDSIPIFAGKERWQVWQRRAPV